MRCPDCGASNPDTARWCGQCYASFAPEQAEAAEPLGRSGGLGQQPNPSEQPTPLVDEPAVAPPADVAAEAVSSTGFRRVGEDVEWECSTCGQFNSIDHLACAVCGTSVAARYEQPEAAAEPVNWNAVLALSVVLPGTGHYVAGRPGAGLARGLLYVVWLTGGLLLLITAGATATLPAVPLLLGALVIWAGTLVDLVNLQRGGRELLGGRVLLWLVVGVTVLLLLGAFGGAARVT